MNILNHLFVSGHQPLPSPLHFVADKDKDDSRVDAEFVTELVHRVQIVLRLQGFLGENQME